MKTGLLLLLAALAARADVCNPRQFPGPYGFQLTGTTTISPRGPQPVATIGRMVFDESGHVSGYSSVNYTGLLLGNPVMGDYEVHTDCSITWSLRDDSGGFQHFSGTVSPGAQRVQFKQTDPGGASRGTLVKTADNCAAADWHKRYRFSISGSIIAIDSGEESGKVALKGTAEIDGNGNLQMTPEGGTAASATLQAEDGCFFVVEVALPAPMKFRAILVDHGTTVLGVETDPGAVVSLKLDAVETAAQ